MLQRVRDQRPSYNNSGRIASSVAVSSTKLLYYTWFAAAYSWAGSFADSVMVNSSWTSQHIAQLWDMGTQEIKAGQGAEADAGSATRRRRLALVFPPCNTKELSSLPLKRPRAVLGGVPRRVIISIGQFRPEKDQLLQLRAFKELKALDKVFVSIYRPYSLKCSDSRLTGGTRTWSWS